MIKTFKSKKGLLEGAPQMALMFGLTVLITAAISLAVESFKNTQTANSAAANVSTFGLQGLLAYSGQFNTIGVVLGVGLIITIVVAAFSGIMRQSGGAF
jgi:hypothetical protein